MPNHPEDIPITLGIEEELFLVDPRTYDILTDPSPEIFEECQRTAGSHKVVREFMRSQIETNTKVCHSIQELRQAVYEARHVVVNATRKFDAAPVAVSIHPFASWRDQAPTPLERYERFAVTFQDGVRRFLVGGMHIHAGFGDADSRIRVMTAIRRFLPLLHALSTSSPFSEGRETGFKSYRLSVVGGLPRTGIPGPLYARSEYERLVNEYQAKKFIENGSELWWDIRPSTAYPTIELRICDVCTRVEDAIAIASLYACLIRWLTRLDNRGELPPEPLLEIIAEDRWIAQRYGVFAFFGDASKPEGRIDIQDYLNALITELTEDARALDCEDYLRATLDIVKAGTSADRQLDLFRLRTLEGDAESEAMHQVVASAVAETLEGLDS